MDGTNAYNLSEDGTRLREDDIVQQTITSLYVKWSKVRTVEHLDRYVRSMLVNTFLDEKRLAWARVRLFAEPPDAVWVDRGGDPDDRTLVRTALTQVPRRQRAVLILRFYYDLPVDEVAGSWASPPARSRARPPTAGRPAPPARRAPGSRPDQGALRWPT